MRRLLFRKNVMLPPSLLKFGKLFRFSHLKPLRSGPSHLKILGSPPSRFWAIVLLRLPMVAVTSCSLPPRLIETFTDWSGDSSETRRLSRSEEHTSELQSRVDI